MSKNDPESGLFHKGEKEKCFAYTATTSCDKNGFIVSTHVTPGNVHDSVSFMPFYEHLKTLKLFEEIKCISCDAGYIPPPIYVRPYLMIIAFQYSPIKDQ
ncbi:MAG: transposase [Culicoidibacterales bacterium]